MFDSYSYGPHHAGIDPYCFLASLTAPASVNTMVCLTNKLFDRDLTVDKMITAVQLWHLSEIYFDSVTFPIAHCVKMVMADGSLGYGA